MPAAAASLGPVRLRRRRDGGHGRRSTRGAAREAVELAPLLARRARSRSSRRWTRSRRRSGARVEEDGSDLRDNASPRLRRLRKELRDGKQRVTERAARVARLGELSEHLQEHFVTERGGRPVLAVKRRRAGKRAGHRARRLQLRADAVRRAVRDRGAEQPARRGGERRARGGRADPARAVAPRRRARGRAARRLVEATGALDLALARARRSRGAGAARQSRSRTRCGCSARATRCSTRRRPVPIDLELGDLRALVDQRAEHGRQDGRAEDARPRRAAAPGGAAAACGRGGAARLRRTCSPTSATSSRSR